MIEQKVKETLTKLFSIKESEMKPDVTLAAGLGFDSTEMVELSLALEKAFSVKFKTNEINKNQSITDIVNAIKAKGINA